MFKRASALLAAASSVVTGAVAMADMKRLAGVEDGEPA